MTSNVAERGLYKTRDGWVQVVAGEQLRRVRAEAYMASGAQPALALLPLRSSEADRGDDSADDTHDSGMH